MEKRVYKTLNMLIKQTEELKKLIEEHPDYPIVVLCHSDVCANDDYNWWYAPTLSFAVGEVLDCEQDIDDMKVYCDRDDFEEDLANSLGDSGNYDEATDDEFDAIVRNKLAEYEPYWKKVIEIRADV